MLKSLPIRDVCLCVPSFRVTQGKLHRWRATTDTCSQIAHDALKNGEESSQTMPECVDLTTTPLLLEHG